MVSGGSNANTFLHIFPNPLSCRQDSISNSCSNIVLEVLRDILYLHFSPVLTISDLFPMSESGTHTKTVYASWQFHPHPKFQSEVGPLLSESLRLAKDRSRFLLSGFQTTPEMWLLYLYFQIGHGSGKECCTKVHRGKALGNMEASETPPFQHLTGFQCM